MPSTRINFIAIQSTAQSSCACRVVGYVYCCYGNYCADAET